MSEDDRKLRMAVIAGASRALKYKAEDWKKRDEEIIQKITDEAQSIVENIDEDF